MTRLALGGRGARRLVAAAVGLMLLGGCEAGSAPAQQIGATVLRPSGALSDAAFAALHARISEDGGYFDTDNLISNESGYLKVIGAIRRLEISGGAYVGVGPDQNYSYIAAMRPAIAFLTDVRRDNTLHHLLLKALIERSPTRVEFLAALHGRVSPPVPAVWLDRDVGEVVAYIDGAPREQAWEAGLQDEVVATAGSFGIPLSEDDVATLRRFHRSFIEAGPGLRFTSFGRAPRPYYPTYRQLLMETDLNGRPSSFLSSQEAYGVVRELHLANRIIPVVGDMSGPRALREMGRVMNEMGVELRGFYTSNVEFYLWRGGTFQAWLDNLAALPSSEDAIIIRSYFPNFGGAHPSAVPGYYATQTLQSVKTLLEGGFSSYWDVVTRGALPLR